MAFSSAAKSNKFGPGIPGDSEKMVYSDRQIFIAINKERLQDITVNAFKQWFAENAVIVYFGLSAPIETPLTPAEIAAYKALIAYAPDTVVQASDGAGIQLGYQRDVNIAIKRIEDAVASMTTT